MNKTEIVSLPNLDFNNLECDNCTAINRRDIDYIKKIERMRCQAFDRLKTPLKVILFCESPPAPAKIKNFVYNDSASSTWGKQSFPSKLNKVLTGKTKKEDLFTYLNEKGIGIIDAAFCPLHRIKKDKKNKIKKRKTTATTCFERHTKAYLDGFPSVKIITIFPVGGGINKKSKSEIEDRIVCSFEFNKLNCLKKIIEDIIQNTL